MVRDLMKFGDDSDFNAFLTEFQAESDRAAGVLGPALLDELLKKLLAALFVEHNKSKELLKENGPLGTFSSRVSTCFALGVISRPFSHDLDLIRKIRNLFAHKIHGWSFNTPEIAHRCNSFEVLLNITANNPKFPGPTAPREKFNFVVAFLAFQLTRLIPTITRMTERPTGPIQVTSDPSP